ncbi:hypothetical protein BG58_38035 [Caballeronia jiangsuensis]|nr:hypothetical protein BG58_38035 [Caballeronia jiangsuensis]
MNVAKFDASVFEEAMSLTEAWNFDLAIQKIIETKVETWTSVRAHKAVQNYKRYMAVTKALGGTQLVPNGDIDEIWHMHILDTRAYMRDSEQLFGKYLHHYPYFGMLGEENERQWREVQGESEKLWQRLFGEALYSESLQAQKCPQLCPCHIDEIDSRGSKLLPAAKAA